jgi:hypothetical protein
MTYDGVQNEAYCDDFDVDSMCDKLNGYPINLALRLLKLYHILPPCAKDLSGLRDTLHRVDEEDIGKRVNRICFLHEQLKHFYRELVPFSTYILGEIVRDGVAHKRSVSKIVTGDIAINDDTSFFMYQNDYNTFIGISWEYPRWKHVESIMENRDCMPPKKVPYQTGFTDIPTVYWEGEGGALEEIEWGLDRKLCEKKYDYFQSQVEWVGVNMLHYRNGYLSKEDILPTLTTLIPKMYYRVLTDSDWMDVAEALSFFCQSKQSWKYLSELCSLNEQCTFWTALGTTCANAILDTDMYHDLETDRLVLRFLKKRKTSFVTHTFEQDSMVCDWIKQQKSKSKHHKILSEIHKHESIVQMTKDPEIDVCNMDPVLKEDVLEDVAASKHDKKRKRV